MIPGAIHLRSCGLHHYPRSALRVGPCNRTLERDILVILSVLSVLVTVSNSDSNSNNNSKSKSKSKSSSHGSHSNSNGTGYSCYGMRSSGAQRFTCPV